MMIGLNMLFIPMYGNNRIGFGYFYFNICIQHDKAFVCREKKWICIRLCQHPKIVWDYCCCVCAFYFWDFPFNPFINIILKSVLITISYVYLNYVFKISADINQVLEKMVPLIKNSLKK